MKLRAPRIQWSHWRAVLKNRWFPWALAGVLLVTTLTNWALLRGERSEDARAAEVASTARDFVHALWNYDYKTIDEDAARIKSFAVGDFADETSHTFSAQVLRQIKRTKLESVGEIDSVNVESVEGETAKVFAAVRWTTRSTTKGTQRSEIRMEAQLIDTDDGWKVNRVDILQSPGANPVGG